MQTTPRLMLFGWSALSNEYPFISMFTLSPGMVESKNISDRHTMSKLLVVIKASINSTLIKSWAASPFQFQWQSLMLDDLFGPGLTSISRGNKSRCLKLFIKNIIVNMSSGKVSFDFAKLSDVPL